MGIRAKSQNRVKISQTSELPTPYITLKIQTHGFEDDLVEIRIRGKPHDAPLPKSWAHEKQNLT